MRTTLGLALLIAALPAAAQSSPRSIAVTFDDLPVASGAFAERVAAQSAITARLMAAVTGQHVPAIGFVNEGKLAPHGPVEPARVALLEQWIDAGLELGNHSYSHLEMYDTPLKAYETDVARGDSVTRALLAAAHRSPPAWFRHPFLSTGRDTATRGRFERWLADRGYHVAPVTINSNEYIFAAAYDKADARHDSSEMRLVAAQYLTYMTGVMAYYERESDALFGRQIPQVLLLHANVLNADHFDELARMLRTRGYAFVTIATAVSDPAYRSADHYTGPDGMGWMRRWALAKGKPPAFFAGMPPVPDWIGKLAAPKVVAH